MIAIVPLNVAALRVSRNDTERVAPKFKGRRARFDAMPHSGGPSGASTGDRVLRPLSENDTDEALGPGIHLHWELPDHFRRGSAVDGDVDFPPAPNRWLITRHLRVFDERAAGYGPISAARWVVESDFVSETQPADDDGTVRPSVVVPLPPAPAVGAKPFRCMGRAVGFDGWRPARQPGTGYLGDPQYAGADGRPQRLTAIGFAGPGFSAYYPECRSVFGFWDRFLDAPPVAAAIAEHTAIRFIASYQVIGWIDDAALDPLAPLAGQATDQYHERLRQCRQEKIDIDRTPADVFVDLAARTCRWQFRAEEITFARDPDTKVCRSLDAPSRTLCAGIIQEVVWDLPRDAGTTDFLGNPDQPLEPAVWQDTATIACGNTTQEALAAELKRDIGNTSTDPDVLANDELLVNALLLGLLSGIEQKHNTIVDLEEALHARGFSRLAGGQLWTVQNRGAESGAVPDADQEVTLPPALADRLAALNAAQKAYDQARAELDLMRRQLFMDWFRFIKMAREGTASHASQNELISFLTASQTGELMAVKKAGTDAGILVQRQDAATGAVSLDFPAGESRAAAVGARYQAMLEALRPHPDWLLRPVPAPPFWLPTDPVLLVEGRRVEPVLRNGRARLTPVRVGAQLIDTLRVTAGTASFTVAASKLDGIPSFEVAGPLAAGLDALAREAALLVPTLASAVADALAAQGGPGNPAAADRVAFAASLRAAQGGLTPLDVPGPAGLYGAIRADDYKAAANPVLAIAAPQAIGITFTNAATNGWPPDAVGWNAPQRLPEFTAGRVDPFLPVFLLWDLQFEPLRWRGAAPMTYAADNVTALYEPGTDGIDYVYRMQGEQPADFTSGRPVRYTGEVAISRRPTVSLAQQIDVYVKDHPDDPANDELHALARVYAARRMLSQSLSGFSAQQTLREYLPRVAVADLTQPVDRITQAIADAAREAPADSWYSAAFNAERPMASVQAAQDNFGPLRAGILDLQRLEIVDAFGQVVRLTTQDALEADTAPRAAAPAARMRAVPALSVGPRRNDRQHQGRVILPPRLLAPTRLWFRWLSAAHGPGDDAVEMNAHPATSPVFGWIVPNHLDDSLFFYDAGGAAVGSFGLEHGAAKYRTRAGHRPDDLEADLAGVNPHLARLMRHIGQAGGKDPGFLRDLNAAILGSDEGIMPAGYGQDAAALAVLIGRPLALARAVIGLETRGGRLPLSQADTGPDDPFPVAVRQGLTRYADRERVASAGLGDVVFPVRLGEVANLEDGLVGFLVEGGGDASYTAFYGPTAPAGGQHGVTRPDPATVALRLNAAPLSLTLLLDPRAAVHATTGVLPVEELRIPPDQFSRAVRALAMTFATHPVLRVRQGLAVPLPEEAGHAWSWVPPGGAPGTPLRASSADDAAIVDFSPQAILEGWLRLDQSTPEPGPPAAGPRG